MNQSQQVQTLITSLDALEGLVLSTFGSVRSIILNQTYRLPSKSAVAVLFLNLVSELDKKEAKESIFNFAKKYQFISSNFNTQKLDDMIANVTYAILTSNKSDAEWMQIEQETRNVLVPSKAKKTKKDSSSPIDIILNA